MSTRSDQRLQRLSGALTPQEALLVWLQEAQACGSLQGYAHSLAQAPEDAFPLVDLPRQMEQAVRLARRGQPEQQVWRAVRQAVRDVGFLYDLVLQLNTRVLQEQRAHRLAIALVAAVLHLVSEDASPHQMAVWRAHAWDEAQGLYVQQGTVQLLAEQSFAGTNPLFPEAAAEVADQVVQMERVLGWFNTRGAEAPRPRSQRAPAVPPPIDLAQLRQAAAPAVQAEVTLVVALAKAAAWNLIEEGPQGLTLLRPYVLGGPPG